MQSLSLKFIQYLREKSKQITDKIVEKSKDCLYDYLVVTEAGAKVNRERWEQYIRFIPKGNAHVIGMNLQTDAKTACIVNGYNAHSLELDDGQRFAMIHLGASIITAIEAASSEHEVALKDKLTGIIMGYEAACRLALAIQPLHKKRGFHAAGTCGTIGAAIGVAYMLGMNDMQMRTVLDCAIASTAGMLEIQEQRSELKPYNLGRAAMDGLTAAYMGYTDFFGPDDIIGGERGFLKLFSGECNPQKTIGQEEYFEIERIYVKPYAACRHCHSAIEGTLNLRGQCAIEEIDKISVETYKLAVKGHDHTDIVGEASAKLSIPYSVAVAYILGKADTYAFDKNVIKRNDVLALTKRVEIIENEDFSALSSQKRIANVKIYLKDGRVLERRIDYAKGDPENPMSRDEIRAKANELLGNVRADDIYVKVYYMEGM